MGGVHHSPSGRGWTAARECGAPLTFGSGVDSSTWVECTTHLQGGGGQQHVGGVHHVGGVQAVVVGHVMVVVVLQRQHEADEGVCWDPERLQEASLLTGSRGVNPD